MGVFSHVFQVEQFILNLQIYYLPMPSYKHFKDLYQEEIMFKSDNGTNFFGASAELNKAF